MAISIQDAEIAHSIQVIKTANGMAKGVDAHLKVIAEYVRSRLAKHDYIDTQKLLNEIRKDVDEVVLKELGEFITELSGDMSSLTDVEINFNREILVAGTSATAIASPSSARVYKLFEKAPLVLNGQATAVDDYLSGFVSSQRDRIKSILIGGWANGKTTREISKEIIGTQSMRGSLDIARSSAFRMAKDLSSHLSNTAKTSFARENDDVIVGERQVSTLDSKTSDICQANDGREYYYDKDGYNFPRPPLHMNCRSTMTFIINPEYELSRDSTRPAVVNGEAKQVSSKEDYVSWIKRQPYEVQVEALGAKRALLIKNMSADDFRKSAYNQLGEYITLDQMAARSKKISDLLAA